jgi:CheY-like chemotaxis protein
MGEKAVVDEAEEGPGQVSAKPTDGGLPVPEDWIPDLVHKLNSPLSSVIGYTQLLLTRVEDPEIREDLERIMIEADQASQVVRDLAQFWRKRKPQKTRTDLRQLIESAIEGKAQDFLLKNITIRTELDAALPALDLDARQFRQVLIHLVNNAVDAITDYHGFGEITISASAEGDRVKIVVADDGPGILPENLPHVLEPFFTTKGKGTGLGLTVSQDVIASHGGTLTFESQFGQGTSFMITLPFKAGKEMRKARREVPEKDLRGLRGLVIDDETTIISVVSRFLEQQGCEALSARDGRQALDLLQGQDVDFIISDVKMPGMAGDEFFRALEERNPELTKKVLFLTGAALTEKVKAFLDTISNPYLEKPFNLKDLKAMIAEILEADKP